MKTTRDELRAAERAYRAATENREAMLAARNAVIRAALEDGWTHEQIAAATGLTRSRITQLARTLLVILVALVLTAAAPHQATAAWHHHPTRIVMLGGTPALNMGPVERRLGERIVIRYGDAWSRPVRARLHDLERLPRRVVNLLVTGDDRFYLGNTLVTHLPGMGYLKGTRLGGASDGDTWDEVPALYVDRTVMVGRYCDRWTLYHEIGHALADPRQLDNTPAWLAIHRGNYGRIDAYERQGGPGGQAGAGEYFADVVATVLVSGQHGACGAYGERAVGYVMRELGLP